MSYYRLTFILVVKILFSTDWIIFIVLLFPNIVYETTIYESETAGDLLPMLNIKKAKSTQVELKPKEYEYSDFYIYLENDTRKGIHTKSIDERLPRALIYRDSFFSSLEPFISPLFSEVEYYLKHFEDSDKNYVLEYKPDIIIFEVVERNAPEIIKD